MYPFLFCFVNIVKKKLVLNKVKLKLKFIIALKPYSITAVQHYRIIAFKY